MNWKLKTGAAFAAMISVTDAYGQSGSSKSVSALQSEINNLFPDNNNGSITPFDLRQVTLDITASYPNFNNTSYVTPSGTFTSGDVITGAGSSTIQDTGVAALGTSGLILNNNISFVTGVSPSSSTDALDWEKTLSGVCNSGAPCSAALFQANSITGTATFPFEVLRANAACCQSSFVGSFQTMEADITVNATSGNTTSPGYVAFISSASAGVNDKGTNTAANGNLFGGNIKSEANSGATFWNSLTGLEVDIGIDANASVLNAAGISVVLEGTNAVAATHDNFGFSVVDGGSSVSTQTMTCAYCIGSYQGFNPLNTSASVMTFLPNGGSHAGPAIAAGIDFTAFTFTGNEFAGPSFSVSNSGAITAASVNVTSSTAPTNGMYVPAGSVLGLSVAGSEAVNITSNYVSLFNGNFNINSADRFAISINSNTVSSVTLRNASGGNAAQETIYFANDASTQQASIELNGSGNTSGNGGSSFSLNGNAGLWLQGLGNDGLEVTTTGSIKLFNQTTSNTSSFTYTVCAGSGANTTTGGSLIMDTSGAACAISSTRFKENVAYLSSDAWREVMDIYPVSFNKKNPGNIEDVNVSAEQLGLTAENVCAVDKRLCVYEPDGSTPRTFRPDAMIGLLVATVKHQQEEIEELREKLK